VERLVCGFFSLRSFDEFLAEAEAAATSEAKKRNKSSSSSLSSFPSKGVSDGRGKAVERREQVEVDEHEDEAEQQQQRTQVLEHLDGKRRGQYEVIESIVRVFGETREAWRKGLYRKEERRRAKEEREARFQAKRRSPHLAVYPTRARGGDGEGDHWQQQLGAKTIVELVVELESLEFANLVTEEQHVVGTSFFFLFSHFRIIFFVHVCFCFCFALQGSSSSKKRRAQGSKDAVSFESMKHRADEGDYRVDFLELEKDFELLIEQARCQHQQDSDSWRRAADKLLTTGKMAINRFLRGNKDLQEQVRQAEASRPRPPPVKRARKSLPPVSSSSEGVARMFGQAETPENLLDQLVLLDHFGFFVLPVDQEDVQDYHLFVKEPVDFSVMIERLRSGHYLAQDPKNLFGFDVGLFEHDLTQISQNCLTYNSQDSMWAQEARRLEQEGRALIQRFIEVVLDPQAATRVRKRVPLYRLGHLSLNSKLLRTLKPEPRMLRALLHNLQRLDWDGLFLGDNDNGGGAFEAMHRRINNQEEGKEGGENNKYTTLEQFVQDFDEVVETRFAGDKPTERKQAIRIRNSASVVLLGQ